MMCPDPATIGEFDLVRELLTVVCCALAVIAIVSLILHVSHLPQFPR